MTSLRKALIIGGGPAGLTAAIELLDNGQFQPIVFEGQCRVGGISATIEHHGNRMDLGGHRFFSKSDRVMKWWLSILTLEETEHAFVICSVEGIFAEGSCARNCSANHGDG